MVIGFLLLLLCINICSNLFETKKNPLARGPLLRLFSESCDLNVSYLYAKIPRSKLGSKNDGNMRKFVTCVVYSLWM